MVCQVAWIVPIGIHDVDFIVLTTVVKSSKLFGNSDICITFADRIVVMNRNA